MSTLVVVPAYNEAQTIGSVVDSIAESHPEYTILVVSDGSSDDTARAARETGKCTVITLPVNLGIGGAVRTGFIYALQEGYDIVVQCDGDGQHEARDIGKLVEPLLKDEVDAVIGSRFCALSQGYSSTAARRVGIEVLARMNSLLIGQRITDSTSGFRAFNRRATQFLAGYYPGDYPEPEAVVLLGRNGYRIKEVPVAMNERRGGRSSISSAEAPYYMLKVTLGMMVSFTGRSGVWSPYHG